MKKLIAWFLIALVAVFVSAWAANAAEVVLPKIIGPHTLAWDDPNPVSVGVTGYHVYYRAPGGTWDDTRMVTVQAPTKTKDLTTVISSNGSYEIAVSAFNASGESGFSTPIPFTLSIPSSVTGSRIQ